MASACDFKQKAEEPEKAKTNEKLKMLCLSFSAAAISKEE